MLRILFLLITLIFSTCSAFAATGQNELPLQSVSNTVIQPHADKTAVLEQLLVSTQSIEIQSKPSPSLAYSSETKSLYFSPFIQAVLLNHKQQSPEYIFIYELLSEQLTPFPNRKTILSPPPKPWFISYPDNRSRLSGWKDGNSLYASKVTYHLN